MNVYRIEVVQRPGVSDPHAEGLAHELKDFGISTVTKVEVRRIFLITSDADLSAIEHLAHQLLIDRVTQTGTIVVNTPKSANPVAGAVTMEVHLQPGVMDPVALSTRQAIDRLDVKVADVRTARMVSFFGKLTDEQVSLIRSRIIANACIEDVIDGSAGAMAAPNAPEYRFELRTVPIRDLSDEELMALSKKSDLFLNLTEMQAIREYYRGIGREATDVEIETLAQTWSEHCGHKTFRSDVDYEGPEGKVFFKNLIKSTVFKVTEDLAKPWCISVFRDNAGIIDFDETFGICFKVETHNHPSAIEPYGGASTGIGGVIRDPLGTGLGAKPVANTDVFCFARPDYELSKLPQGVLHPRKVLKGVVSGVRDYGNRMGIPTVNGALWFDDRYLGNPLVYCGNVGLIPKDKCFGKVKSGDMIVVLGGRTGRDGIHGATFSSGELTDRSDTEFSHAVQIGNAITEKKVGDVIMQARDHRDGCLYNAITDCGAGGLSSAIGEMGETTGAEVNLDLVPLKYEGLRYDEIWISEAQERMVLAVPADKWPTLKALCDGEDVEATAIGTFATHGKLVLRYRNTQVADIAMAFVHKGIPQPVKRAVWKKPNFSEPKNAANDFGAALRALLNHANIASKEWVIRQYDHEVQGGSVIKPLVGVANDGPGDAAVVRPILTSKRAVALSCGLNPNFGQIDPYWMAACCIDEAVRNAVAVGGDPDRCAILDNFCWGNCNDLNRMGSLVRCLQGCYDAAKGLGTPFISGKDSLNNEFLTDSGERIVIPDTLLISAMAIVPDIERCVTMDFKSAGNAIYLVGRTRAELGGSHYWQQLGHIGNSVPTVDFALAKRIYTAMHAMILAGTVRSCHDCSEGGLAVALAEMAFAGGLGATIDLSDLAKQSSLNAADAMLFSESPTRFVIEVTPENESAFLKATAALPVCRLGSVNATSTLNVAWADKTLIAEKLSDLKHAWQTGLKV
jgi:phosphoribosylformylglycinamidine synthase